MFEKGNNYGKGRKAIYTTTQQWQKAIELWHLGFSAYAIAKRTSIPKSQLVKVLGYQNSKTRNDVKDDVCNIGIEWYADISDLTFRSIKKANKHAKVFKTADGYFIKIACATDGKTIILMFFATKRKVGEFKEFWNALLLECAKRKVKTIAVDTNARFDDIIRTVKLPKTTEKPYNTVVEQIFTAKRFFYTYYVKHTKEELSLNHVIAYLQKMYTEKFYNKQLILSTIIQ